jgi:3',5'-nucleoside bisphosphate phosphatase
MERLIDLHTHSTASDGSMRPAELVRYAKRRGLSAIAITDHDTVDGIQEALDEAEKEGIEVIPGIEISTDFKPEMHILGYFFNSNHLRIKDSLIVLKNGRDSRNTKIISKLNEIGISITLDDVVRETLGEIMGRPHIAKALMSKGYVKSISEAFDKYLCDGGIAYFKRFELKPEDGIREIIIAGGIPVLAHPIHLHLSYSQLDELLCSLVSFGIKGIEAYYVDNLQEDTGNLLRLAIKYNLLVTGGSDFHGSFKTGIDIGRGRGNLKVTYDVLEKLKNASI